MNLEMSSRYSRQIILPEIGQAGQSRLNNARVVLIGVGGVGCSAAAYLVGAGIGHLCLIDSDRVEITNLQRQILYSDTDIGSFKSQTAGKKLSAQNPEIEISSVAAHVDGSNVDEMIGSYDFVAVATDNLEAKVLLSGACVRNEKKLFIGSATAFSGQVFSYLPGSACLGCFFPDAVDAASEFADATHGIVGAAAGAAGTLLASAVINSVLGVGDVAGGRLTTFDTRTMRFQNLERKVNPNCPLCGNPDR